MSSKWEARARGVEAFLKTDTVTVDSLRKMADSLVKVANKKDTIVKKLVLRIPVVDSTHHPDSTCGPSLAIRDSVIHALDDELLTQKAAFLDFAIAATKVAVERDSLEDVLAARPKTPGLTLALIHPEIEISAQAMIYPEQRIGIGVSIPLVKIPIHVHL